MTLFNKLDHWADDHHPRLLDLIRILLGLIIFFKGLYFISHPKELETLLLSSKFPWLSFAIGHYVAFAHLVGGLLILIGMFTRLAVAIQIPILAGAVIFVNAPMGFFNPESDLPLALMALALLVFYFFYGSGFWSVDHQWRKEEEIQ